MLPTKEELKTFFLHFLMQISFTENLVNNMVHSICLLQKYIYFKISVIGKINKTDIMEGVLQFKD